MNILTLLSLVAVIIFTIESVYSFYKKDTIYSKKGTTGNVLTFVFLSFVSQKVAPLCLGYFLVWYSFLHHSSFGQPLISFLYALILVDFAYYLFHRLLHSVNVFWVFHRVHHSDNKFNLSTSFRISLIEHLAILLFFAPVLLFGVHPETLFDAIYFLGLYQFICHSQYITFPKMMLSIFITPQSHRTHHSQASIDHTSNFGGILSVWDRMFGTYRGVVEDVHIGIKGYHEDNPVMVQLHSFLQFFKK